MLKTKGRGAYIIDQKELFTLDMLPNNEKNKLRQTKKDQIKKKVSYIIQPYENMLSVSLFGYFSSYKLAKHT